MEQLNKIELRGRVGNVRISPVGDKSVCHFSVATNTIYRGQDNNAVEETTWHNCTLWSNKKFPDLTVIKVGAGVEIVGRMRGNRFIGSDGVERYSYEVMVSELNLLPDTEPLRSASAI